MKNNKNITILVLIIILLTIVVSLIGLLSNGENDKYSFTSITDEPVEIYGQGIYKNDSVSVVAQGKASDFITLIVAVPLLTLSLFFTIKNSFRWKLVLLGILGYLLYTYTSYVFLWTYNPLFLLYIALMSTSLFAFILCITSFNIEKLPSKFNNKLPVKSLGIFQIVIGLIVGYKWLSDITLNLINNTPPENLQHYTTLVIHALDLGFFIPIVVLGGVLIIKRKPFGYLLTSITLIKLSMLLLTITAMIINLLLFNQNPNIESVAFIALNILIYIPTYFLLKHADKQIV